MIKISKPETESCQWALEASGNIVFFLCRLNIAAKKKKKRRIQSIYIYISPHDLSILSLTFSDSQPLRVANCNVICHVLLYDVLLVYNMKRCIKEKVVLKDMPAE